MALSGKRLFSLAVRLPDGSRVCRKFLSSDRLALVRDWVASMKLDGAQVPPRDKFAFVTQFPKRTLDNFDLSLEEANLEPRSLLGIMEL